MKTLIVVSATLFLAAAACTAQTDKYDIVSLGTGNFTKSTLGTYFATNHTLRQSSRAAAGEGAEFERWWRKNGVAVVYAKTPTNSKLSTPAGKADCIWPISRYEVDILAQHRFRSQSRVSPYLGAGAMGTLLNGGKISGYDGQYGAALSAGINLQVARNLKLRTGLLLDSLKASTYSDPAYTASRTLMFEPEFGFVWRFRSLSGMRLAKDKETAAHRGEQAGQ